MHAEGRKKGLLRRLMQRFTCGPLRHEAEQDARRIRIGKGGTRPRPQRGRQYRPQEVGGCEVLLFRKPEIEIERLGEEMADQYLSAKRAGKLRHEIDEAGSEMEPPLLDQPESEAGGRYRLGDRRGVVERVLVDKRRRGFIGQPSGADERGLAAPHDADRASGENPVIDTLIEILEDFFGIHRVYIRRYIFSLTRSSHHRRP